MKSISSLIAGLIFGTGLILSGMANPAKVQNFLDVFGTWDPSLAFVMGGAIAITMPGFWLTQKRTKPLFQDAFHLPTRSDISTRLIIGASIFGIGWGLGGFCPGPAITAIPTGMIGTSVFVFTMVVGMWLAKLLVRSTDKAATIQRSS